MPRGPWLPDYFLLGPPDKYGPSEHHETPAEPVWGIRARCSLDPTKRLKDVPMVYDVTTCARLCSQLKDCTNFSVNLGPAWTSKSGANRRQVLHYTPASGPTGHCYLCSGDPAATKEDGMYSYWGMKRTRVHEPIVRAPLQQGNGALKRSLL
eukprot:GEMP01044567.1.p1 GENE.GEMP01044567.1~~GEMP01044567.1.p1  ORF type:complete len:152 (+),score=22.44 GEMP01044567.1:165-620(+)